MLSPTALSDPDTRPAHSVVLEAGAELGLVGIALLALVVAWGYWRLTVGASPAVLVGIAAWTALWLHSLVDYVADFSSVLLAAGLVLGAAVGPRQVPSSEPILVGNGFHWRADGLPGSGHVRG